MLRVLVLQAGNVVWTTPHIGLVQDRALWQRIADQVTRMNVLTDLGGAQTAIVILVFSIRAAWAHVRVGGDHQEPMQAISTPYAACLLAMHSGTVPQVHGNLRASGAPTVQYIHALQVVENHLPMKG